MSLIASPKMQQQLVGRWNEHNPVGTLVKRFTIMRPRRGNFNYTKTRSEAWLMGGHSAVVMVDNVAGAVSVESLEVQT